MTGTFAGLNAATAEIMVADIAPGQPGSNGQGPVMQPIPVPLSASTTTVPAP